MCFLHTLLLFAYFDKKQIIAAKVIHFFEIKNGKIKIFEKFYLVNSFSNFFLIKNNCTFAKINNLCYIFYKKNGGLFRINKNCINIK